MEYRESTSARGSTPDSTNKNKNDNKLDEYFVKTKLFRDPTSESLDLCEFKMTLFDNGKLEEIFLFINNFNMNLEASGTLKSGAENQYILMMLRGESLRQFDTLSAELGSKTPEQLMSIILGLGTYFFLLIPCQRKRA